VDELQRELIQRCLGGDRSAFEALHAAHVGRVRAYLLRCGFDAAGAEDLTQDVFLRAFRSLHTYDAAKGSFRLWLAVIARNVANKQWHRRAQAESFDPKLAEEMFAAPDNPRDWAEAREESQAVRACVDALPADLAELVRLRYVDARTTRGIAAATGLPEATVRLRLAEAIAILARWLREKGFVE